MSAAPKVQSRSPAGRPRSECFSGHRLRAALITGPVLAVGIAIMAAFLPEAHSGPYSPGKGGQAEAGIPDAGVPGFVGDSGEGTVAGNFVNPVFFGWAADDPAPTYSPSDPPAEISAIFSNPIKATGPVTGDNFDVVSLGDMSAAEIAGHLANPSAHPLGSLILSLEAPIRNLSGADFAAYENGFVSAYSTGAGSVQGLMFAELGFLEVSSNGSDFARFPSTYLNPAPVGSQAALSQNVSNVSNLVGKHANFNGISWGTPFDLSDLAENSLVVAGTVDLNNIRYVRIVDIPGNGTFLDATGKSIYDAWVTVGSGGVDFEALGLISRPIDYDHWPQLQSIANVSDRDEGDDPDGDGWSNLEEYAFAQLPWKRENASNPHHIEWVAEEDSTQHAEFVFKRDERLSDLTYQVWASDDLEDWEPIASSSAGAPALPVTPSETSVSESNAATYGPIGVIRLVRIRETVEAGTLKRRFYKIELIREPAVVE